MKEKKYQCDQCGEFFKTANARGAHKRLKHGTQVEKIDSNALLDFFRDIKTDLEKLKGGKGDIGNTEREGVKTLPDTNVKEGFDTMSEGVVQGISTILKRVDGLEKKLGESENANAQASMNGTGKLLERIDSLEKKVKEREEKEGKGGRAEEVLSEAVKLAKETGVDVKIKKGKPLLDKRDKGFMDYVRDDDPKYIELRKRVEELAPIMSKLHYEIKKGKLIKKG